MPCSASPTVTVTNSQTTLYSGTVSTTSTATASGSYQGTTTGTSASTWTATFTNNGYTFGPFSYSQTAASTTVRTVTGTSTVTESSIGSATHTGTHTFTVTQTGTGSDDVTDTGIHSVTVTRTITGTSGATATETTLLTGVRVTNGVVSGTWLDVQTKTQSTTQTWTYPTTWTVTATSTGTVTNTAAGTYSTSGTHFDEVLNYTVSVTSAMTSTWTLTRSDVQTSTLTGTATGNVVDTSTATATTTDTEATANVADNPWIINTVAVGTGTGVTCTGGTKINAANGLVTSCGAATAADVGAMPSSTGHLVSFDSHYLSSSVSATNECKVLGNASLTLTSTAPSVLIMATASMVQTSGSTGGCQIKVMREDASIPAWGVAAATLNSTNPHAAGLAVSGFDAPGAGAHVWTLYLCSPSSAFTCVIDATSATNFQSGSITAMQWGY